MSISVPPRLAAHLQPTGPVVIAIMDGVGCGPADAGDAVHLAHTPNLDALWATTNTRQLRAHGFAVGLPSDGDMGNSEVGHNALGCGRIVRQGAALVQDALASGALFEGADWRWLMQRLSGDFSGDSTSDPTSDLSATLHLCGLLSDGNVHAHIDHVLALIDRAATEGVQHIRIHALADGRDVADPSFERYLTQLDAHLAPHLAAGRDYRLASAGGRMLVTMDRYEADWSVVERGWQAHVQGLAPGYTSWQAALRHLRGQPEGSSDQNLPAFCIHDAHGQPVGRVQSGDSFILWNFRGDRAIQITRAFSLNPEFTGFERDLPADVRFAGMMQYDGDLQLPRRFLVTPPHIDHTLGDVLVAAGVRSLAVSETQKFGHVTYFWNGNRSQPLDADLDQWLEIPSDRVAFDTAPTMKAAEITDAVIAALNTTEPPAMIRLNWPNGDMVGHTGNLAATITAMEAVDLQVGRLVAAVRAAHGSLILTADHGNADDMWLRSKDGAPLRRADDQPQPRTSHTLAAVPFTLLDSNPHTPWQLRSDLPSAGLANVAATALMLLGFATPAHMEPSLIVQKHAAPTT